MLQSALAIMAPTLISFLRPALTLHGSAAQAWDASGLKTSQCLCQPSWGSAQHSWVPMIPGAIHCPGWTQRADSVELPEQTRHVCCCPLAKASQQPARSSSTSRRSPLRWARIKGRQYRYARLEAAAVLLPRCKQGCTASCKLEFPCRRHPPPMTPSQRQTRQRRQSRCSCGAPGSSTWLCARAPTACSSGSTMRSSRRRLSGRCHELLGHQSQV